MNVWPLETDSRPRDPSSIVEKTASAYVYAVEEKKVGCHRRAFEPQVRAVVDPVVAEIIAEANPAKARAYVQRPQHAHRYLSSDAERPDHHANPHTRRRP